LASWSPSLVSLEDALTKLPLAEDMVPHMGCWLGSLREVLEETALVSHGNVEYDPCKMNEKFREQDKILDLGEAKVEVNTAE
jgi:hypothetical protein